MRPGLSRASLPGRAASAAVRPLSPALPRCGQRVAGPRCTEDVRCNPATRRGFVAGALSRGIPEPEHTSGLELLTGSSLPSHDEPDLRYLQRGPRSCSDARGLRPERTFLGT